MRFCKMLLMLSICMSFFACSNSSALSLSSPILITHSQENGQRVSLQHYNLPGYLCQTTNIVFKKNFVTLNSATSQRKQRVYIFHNKSKYKLMLDIPPAMHTGASAGWNTTMDAGNWSVLTVANKRFSLTCYRQIRSKFRRISCDDKLLACQVDPRILKKANWQNKGGYWLIENVNLKKVKAKLASKNLG